MSSSPVIVAVGRNVAEAQIWVDALRSAGIRATTFERSEAAAMGIPVLATATFPVLVPAARIGDARNVIAELGGASRLAPVDDGGSGVQASWLILPGIAAAIAVAFVIAMVLLVEYGPG